MPVIGAEYISDAAKVAGPAFDNYMFATDWFNRGEADQRLVEAVPAKLRQGIQPGTRNQRRELL